MHVPTEKKAQTHLNIDIFRLINRLDLRHVPGDSEAKAAFMRAESPCGELSSKLTGTRSGATPLTPALGTQRPVSLWKFLSKQGLHFEALSQINQQQQQHSLGSHRE